jgi:alkylhydroperoxidase family enzyme
LAQAPEAAAGLARFGDGLETASSLDPLVRQVAVLVAVRRSAYETQLETAKALRLGLNPDLLETFEEEDWTHPGFDDAQRAAFRYAMLFDGGYGVQAESFAELKRHLSDPQIAELSLVLAYHGALARLAIALGFAPESE